MPRPLRDRYRLGGAPKGRQCDHPDCDEAGEFRAPKSRAALRDYYWFCKSHVRDYNAKWNYCAGLDTDDIDRMTWDDACWQRPTWPMNGKGYDHRSEAEFDDPFGFFDDIKEEAGRTRSKRRHGPDNPYMKALDVLGLSEPLTMTALKQRYKALAKELHPDVNGHNKKAEDRLKAINHAYSVLKKNLMQNQGETAM